MPTQHITTRAFALSVAALAVQGFVHAQNTSISEEPNVLSEVRVLGTAEDVARQALGSSVITAEDIARSPVSNDMAEIIRTMPGVNLTGASSSGSYGNQRQIDLRGMGPENTLILINGKPVQSREAALMRRSGERDTRGDTNWVPAEQIERIEVIRGPAAARYGSGAAGGVINIITKKPDDKFSGSVTSYYQHTEDSDEGNSKRLGFNLSGPMAENLSFRLYGNIAKTEADFYGINGLGNYGLPLAAGREGNRNRDINALIRWDLTPSQFLELETGFSRQGNIYVGESPGSAGNQAAADTIMALIGEEVRRTYRRHTSITHHANIENLGKVKTTIQYEGTDTSNCLKAGSGGPEGTCQTPLAFSKSKLESYYFNTELNAPSNFFDIAQMVTYGFEYRDQKLDDPESIRNVPAGVTQLDKNSKVMKSKNFAAYIENNIALTDNFILTPGARLDHSDKFGNNWTPSLNADYQISDNFNLKGGIARVFKTPNLYQSNPDYWYNTNGMGCPLGVQGPCYIQGNPNLSPEVSLNKEIGAAWDSHTGWTASLTYFRNDYKNKIVADMGSSGAGSVVPIPGAGNAQRYQWFNSGKAIVEGIEGSLNIPLLGINGNKLKLINNFTWMKKNHTKENNQPLSIIPKYTINSTLDWTATQKLSAQLKLTVYGRQIPRKHSPTNSNSANPIPAESLEQIGTYSLFGVGMNYNVSKNLRIGAGISNLLDKQFKREGRQTSSAGAFTYNQPGRAYYLTATASF